MGKYTKAPGMHEFAYNNWLFNIHTSLNHKSDIALINRDGFKLNKNIPGSYIHTRKREFFELKAIRNLNECELFILKSRRVNTNPLYENITNNKKCLPCVTKK